jgi:hypothetical protein
VAPDGIASLKRLAAHAGADLQDLGPEDFNAGNGLRELSWNHTTLHMRASEPGWTYLQMLLPQPELPAMQALRDHWGDDLLWHLELVKQQGSVRVAAVTPRALAWSCVVGAAHGRLSCPWRFCV